MNIFHHPSKVIMGIERIGKDKKCLSNVKDTLRWLTSVLYIENMFQSKLSIQQCANWWSRCKT